MDVRFKIKDSVKSLAIVGIIGLLNYSMSIIWGIPFLNLIIPFSLLLIVSCLALNEFSNKGSKIVFILIFLFKFLMLVYQAKYRDLPMGGNDWVGYNRHAINLLAESKGIFDLLIIPEVNLFSRFISLVYYLFGTHLALINCFVLILSIIMIKYIYKISYILTKSKRIADISSLLIFVWPIDFIFSITVLREMPIQWSFVMSLYFFLLYLNKKKYSFFILSIIFSLIASAFHAGMIGVVIIYMVVNSIYDVKRSLISVFPVKLVSTILLFLFIWLTPLSDVVTQKFSGIENTEDLIDKVSYSAGDTAYVSSTPGSIPEVIVQMPYRVLMFTLSPLPWQINGAPTFIAWLIDGLPRLLLLMGIGCWIKRYKPKNNYEMIIKWTFISIIVVTYLIHAGGTANYGTAMRHRAKMLPLEVLLLVWGIFLKKKDYKKDL
ncbi:hypothetical protein AAIE21_17205 [Paenibacillus sp. 102]|uniref:hypothetical protein n=1 Tax=Paenibacillus sp. 102 TaxID=3120823 RepID=UPI0031BBB622